MAEKDLGGRPPFEPTDDHRRLVEGMAAVRVPQIEIARLLVPGGIDVDTLRKYFQDELDTGHIKASTKLRQSQFERATEGKSDTMAIWLGKQWLGQREPKDATPAATLMVAYTPEQFAALSDEELERFLALSRKLEAAAIERDRSGTGETPGAAGKPKGRG